MVKKLVVDCSTGITSEIELTADEAAQHAADALAWEEAESDRLAAQEAAEAAKQSGRAKLSALGLTDDEISALTK